MRCRNYLQRRPRGFTFLGILIAIAILGVALSAAGSLWTTVAQRDREAELLFVGEAYRSAIASYFRAGGRLPLELQDLVDDRRMPAPRRHLRRLYNDPITGRFDWELILAPDGGIIGLHSASQKTPIKRANFPVNEAEFTDAQCYCDWTFLFSMSRQRRPSSNGHVTDAPPLGTSLENGSATAPSDGL